MRDKAKPRSALFVIGILLVVGPFIFEQFFSEMDSTLQIILMALGVILLFVVHFARD